MAQARIWRIVTMTFRESSAARFDDILRHTETRLNPFQLNVRASRMTPASGLGARSSRTAPPHLFIDGRRCQSVPRAGISESGSCVTSIAGPHDDAQLYDRSKRALRVRQSGADLNHCKLLWSKATVVNVAEGRNKISIG